jgi:adenosine deaminase
MTKNSDSAYFSGYITDNFNVVADVHPMEKAKIAQFTINAIKVSFISEQEKQRLLTLTLNYLEQY